ncbi:TolC family protein [Panacagrimonas sp.]|uniref:TolC family protein n=1 Tax=Panacagrimonas sp. TaxID=2480088 RepID=UPI003B515F49
MSVFLAARNPRVLLAILGALTGPAAFADDSDIALDLDAAQELAVTRQPLLEALNAQARAERESAVAAGQLPDPQLSLGVQGLPINSDDAGSFTRDSDTQLTVGFTQEFPRAAKRRLRGALNEREAQRLDAQAQLAERSIRRDTALAWLELWRFEQALLLNRASLREAEAQMQAVEIALKTSSATQAELLGARVEVGRMRDAVAGAEQSIGHARNVLSRWIGEAAFRPVCPDLPAPPLPTLAQVLERVRMHPQLASLEVQISAAQTGAELARAAYAPDWRVELAYADRPAFSEMVSVQVGIDLPVFTRNRQDRGLAAALARGDAADAAAQDALRELQAEARLNYHDSERLYERLDAYNNSLLPDSAHRVEAALAGWGAGRNALREVLEARRATLELQMTRLELQHDAAKHAAQLEYLGAYADTAETIHE